MRSIAGFILGFLVASQVVAEEGMRRLSTMDESRAWAAVGRLELNGTGFCTGALIAPDLVLTAAHCLYDKETEAAIPAHKIQFRAGWRDGNAVAFRDVRRFVKHPRYEFEEALAGLRVANDLALLELRRPIKSGGIRPFKTADSAQQGDMVGVVSYAVGRSEAPTLQEVCEIVEQSQQIMVMSCDVDFGASGAPVFRFDDDGPKIVSVVSAKAELDGERVSVGAPLHRNLQVLWDELIAMDGRGFEAPPGVKSVKVRRSSATDDPSNGRSVGGAKFVKP